MKIGARWREIQNYHAAHSLTETARRFGVTPAAIIYWRRKLGEIPEDQRFGGDELGDDIEAMPRKTKKRSRPLAPPLADWTFPRPAEEAKFLLNVADNNGGRESMRRLISVTPEQRADLERLVASGQVSQKRVEQAIEFRREVLEAFNKLTAAWDAPAVADGRKASAPRRRGLQPRILQTGTAAVM